MSRKAFTLVELMVVIGIIALLISMLLPALNRAKDSARAIKCASQMHQMGIATSNYVAENRGYLFPTSYSAQSNVAFPLATATDVTVILKPFLPRLTGGNVSAEGSVWKCPSVPREQQTAQFQLTYGFNQGVHVPWSYTSGLPTYSTLRKITQYRRATELCTIVDASLSSGAFTTTGRLDFTENANFRRVPASPSANMTDPTRSNNSVTLISGWDKNNDVGNYHMRWRHSRNNVANMLYLDGHVSSSKYSEKEPRMRNFATGY